MQPDDKIQPAELSEAEKWQKFHAAMALEKEYVAREEGWRQLRERTRLHINWAAALWFVFVLCAIWTFADSSFGQFWRVGP